MSNERRRKKSGFLYTREIIVWTLLLAFLIGLLVYNKDRIFKGGSEKTAESESDPFPDDHGDIPSETPEETEPPESETAPPESSPEADSGQVVPEGSGPLRVYFLDVGEGDAAVLMLDGKVMMIDGGDETHAQNVCTWLQAQGIGRVDYMICSHPHKDHASGLVSVYQVATVGKLYTPVQEYADNVYFTSLIDTAYTEGTEVSVPVPGETFAFGPAEVMFQGPVRYDAEEMNNNSLVVRVRYGNRTFLFTGDAEAEEEADILAAGFDVKADVLKVSHHGSGYATSEAFINSVRPESCIISVGPNDYGHPAGEVIQRCSNVGAMVYETMISGTITVITDGTSLQYNFER